MINYRRLQWIFYISMVTMLIMLVEDVAETLGVTWIVEWESLHYWEFLLVGLLLVLLAYIWSEAGKLKAHSLSLEGKVERASGAFQELLNGYFDKWDFSPAEQDVARLIRKGCSIAEIADIRGAKEGTIKAQTNSIYRKSGYGSKTQLLSAFIEDLTDGGSVDSKPTKSA